MANPKTAIKLQDTKGSMRNAVRATATVAGFLFIAYWAIFGWMVYVSPLKYSEMDFDHDGRVSYSEADYASSFGTRRYGDVGITAWNTLLTKMGCP